MTKPPNINDMTTARAWAEHIVNNPETSLPMETAAARALMALLPPRPTLADMTDAEREACDGMQADLAGGGRAIILYSKSDRDGLVQVLESTLDVYRPRPAQVTPRPDLPRFVWPDDTPETPASAPTVPEGWRLADHPDHGHVIVTNPTPDPVGDVYLVMPNPGDPLGHDWMFCRPDELAFLDAPTPAPAPSPAPPDGWRLADHKDYGRVVVTNPDPDRDGYVYFVFPDDDTLGYDWHFCRSADLTYTDQGTD